MKTRIDDLRAALALVSTPGTHATADDAAHTARLALAEDDRVAKTTDAWHDLMQGIKTKKIGAHEGAGIYLLRFDPGAVIGPESHPQRETGVVLEGAVKLRLGFVDELVDGDDLTGFDVSPGEEHTITAGPAGALLLVVARPDWPER